VSSARLLVQRVRAGALLPRRMTERAAGLDLFAWVEDGGSLRIEPLARCAVPTGVRVAIGEGFEGQVRPRSGLALRNGITLANSPGTIDADYRGELLVLLVNLGNEAYDVQHGDRIAQLVIAPVVAAEIVEVEGVEDSERGEGGFGSTGR
jgi:dUTP pyrophosphatase